MKRDCTTCGVWERNPQCQKCRGLENFPFKHWEPRNKNAANVAGCAMGRSEWQPITSVGRSNHPNTTPLSEYIEEAERDPENKRLLNEARERSQMSPRSDEK